MTLTIGSLCSGPGNGVVTLQALMALRVGWARFADLALVAS